MILLLLRENKKLYFIRIQITFKECNQKTSHCIYGVENDLIML